MKPQLQLEVCLCVKLAPHIYGWAPRQYGDGLLPGLPAGPPPDKRRGATAGC